MKQEIVKNNQGKVYIAAMNMRGKWAEKPLHAQVVNVTSAQAKFSTNRNTFSPMSPVYGGYKGYYCFENYWQAGKVYETIDRKQQIKWWKDQVSGKRRYPNSKEKKVLYADHGDGKKRNYLQSRKQVYVPQYYDLIKDKQQTILLKKQVSQGNNIVIFDFDGPRDKNGSPICLQLTKELLLQKINDPKDPFGHGYIVAAELAGFNPSDYI